MRPTTTKSDEEILADYRHSRKSTLFGELYSSYVHLVYGVCLKYLKSREDSKDAVMDIYEVVAEKLLHQEVKSFRSWLYAVTKNHCLVKLRKTGEVSIDSIYMEIDPHLHLYEEREVLEDNLQKLEACIEQLKDNQRSCVDLFYLKNFSYQKIADELVLETKHVKSYIQNGKRNLKICMEAK